MWMRIALAVGLVCAGTGADVAQARESTLALEAAYLTVSSDFAAESPPGSGIQHDGSIDGGDPAFGLTLETRLTRHVGLRIGGLWGSIGISARSVCADGPCSFMRGPVRVSIDDVEWSVDDDGDLRALFLEVPFILQPRANVELFAGPTIATVEVGDVAASGPDGLAVDADASSPSFGLHLGGAFHFGGRRGPGRREPAWTAGVIARWVPTDIKLTVRQPILGGAPDLLTVEAEEDLVTVSVVLGRRFGRSGR